MSFVVRNTFPYKNKYFSSGDSQEQETVDYIMHEYLDGRHTSVYSTSLPLDTVTQIKEALDSSDLFNATVTIDEVTDTSTEETIVYRTITYTKL